MINASRAPDKIADRRRSAGKPAGAERDHPRRGREIHQAGSGEEALALLLQHDFAMAILDVQMPGMDGFELAELMRGTDKTRHIPIVFVTAAGKELNYSFKGYEAGAVDVLYKPLDARAVNGKVQVFVALYEQRRRCGARSRRWSWRAISRKPRWPS
jgi:CheY-like chemotaxis protein